MHMCVWAGRWTVTVSFAGEIMIQKKPTKKQKTKQNQSKQTKNPKTKTAFDND